jgi:hypothetical protein
MEGRGIWIGIEIGEGKKGTVELKENRGARQR